MKVDKTESEWEDELTPEEYHVLREKGTEPAFSGEYVHTYDDGTYHCAACNAVLFDSSTKFESTMPGLEGWPAFEEVALSDAVKLVPDESHGMSRTEVICSNCGSHLGHYFDDPSSSTGKHYCVNSLSLKFDPNE